MGVALPIVPGNINLGKGSLSPPISIFEYIPLNSDGTPEGGEVKAYFSFREGVVLNVSPAPPASPRVDRLIWSCKTATLEYKALWGNGVLGMLYSVSFDYLGCGSGVFLCMRTEDEIPCGGSWSISTPAECATFGYVPEMSNAPTITRCGVTT